MPSFCWADLFLCSVTSADFPTSIWQCWLRNTCATLSPYIGRRPASWIRTSSGKQIDPSARSRRIPAGTIKSIPRIKS
ncbi:hypothetical protein PR002_g18610 [Phytophthora rubi]|uniref:Secreted protein n=1 Tax=Phytophthora rubi TaxID=129364 RepID=A0A6A3JUB7_9STRA|nr:hypothetical protein PR002_g18610 [Phytophthora rubi]